MEFGFVRISYPTPEERLLCDRSFSWGTHHSHCKMVYPPQKLPAIPPRYICINECFDAFGRIRPRWEERLENTVEQYRNSGVLILNDYIGIRSALKWGQVYRAAKRLGIENIGIQIHASWWDVEKLGMLVVAERIAQLMRRAGFRVWLTEVAVYGRYRAHGSVKQMQDWQVQTLDRIHALALQVESPIFGFIEPTRSFCWNGAYRHREAQYLWHPDTLEATHLGDWYAKISGTSQGQEAGLLWPQTAALQHPEGCRRLGDKAQPGESKVVFFPSRQAREARARTTLPD